MATQLRESTCSEGAADRGRQVKSTAASEATKVLRSGVLACDLVILIISDEIEARSSINWQAARRTEPSVSRFTVDQLCDFYYHNAFVIFVKANATWFSQRYVYSK